MNIKNLIIILLLFDNFYVIQSSQTEGAWSPLRCAVQQCNIKLVEKLLQEGTKYTDKSLAILNAADSALNHRYAPRTRELYYQIYALLTENEDHSLPKIMPTGTIGQQNSLPEMPPFLIMERQQDQYFTKLKKLAEESHRPIKKYPSIVTGLNMAGIEQTDDKIPKPKQSEKKHRRNLTGIDCWKEIL